MSAKPQRARAPLANERWCTAKEIVALLGLKLSTVYHGQAGTDRIRRAYVAGTEKKKRPTVRFWYADAVAMSAEMLKESEPTPDPIPTNISRLLPQRRRQR